MYLKWFMGEDAPSVNKKIGWNKNGKKYAEFSSLANFP